MSFLKTGISGGGINSVREGSNVVVDTVFVMSSQKNLECSAQTLSRTHVECVKVKT